MNLTINGEARFVPNVHNLKELLYAFHLEHKILVIELNRVIIDRDRYEETSLQEGDSIEIVHFVGGG